MGKSLERGKRAEQQAAEFLRSHGYQIVEENYRWPGGEIDLIARDGEFLVFVEVKARSSESFGIPEEFVNARKQHKLIRTAQRYLLQHPTKLNVRFDVVALSRGTARLHQNAFSLEG